MALYQTYKPIKAIKRSSRGITLIEMLLVCSLTVIVATAVSGVYYYMMSLWERGGTVSSGYSTTLTGMERIDELISEAFHIYDISSPNRLEFLLPHDEDDGDFIPVRFGTKHFSYRPGIRILLYLSDETGQIGKDGDILWRAVHNGSRYAPDEGWSLGHGSPIVAPLNDIEFTAEKFSSSHIRLVSVTLTSGKEKGDKSELVVLKRSVRIRNCHYN